MKGNALKSYSKRSVTLRLLLVDGRQWLGVDGACYPMDGYPPMNEETLLTVLEIDEKKRDAHIVEMRLEVSEDCRLLMADLRDGEEPSAVISQLDITLPLYGTYRLVCTEQGDKWVKTEALRPLGDVLEKCTFHYRKAGGLEVVAVMLGMQNVGLLSCVSAWVDVENTALLKRAASAAQKILLERQDKQ